MPSEGGCSISPTDSSTSWSPPCAWILTRWRGSYRVRSWPLYALLEPLFNLRIEFLVTHCSMRRKEKKIRSVKFSKAERGKGNDHHHCSSLLSSGLMVNAFLSLARVPYFLELRIPILCLCINSCLYLDHWTTPFGASKVGPCLFR